jgi:hypothetical protein
MGLVDPMDFGPKIERCRLHGSRLEEVFVPGEGWVFRCEFCLVRY